VLKGFEIGRSPRRALLLATLISVLPLLAVLGAGRAAAGPTTTRLMYAAGRIVPIPASIPHEEGDMVDSRIVPDLRWIAQRFPIYITDGYSGPLPDGEHVGCNRCHVKGSDHYNGLAVDIVPLGGSTTCDASWRPITRLAKWAEPVQNQPVPPFRWVGYNGDAGHGCGNHLHLSWNHSPAPEYTLAEWVEVFPAKLQGPSPQPQANPTPAPAPKAPRGPAGGARPEKQGGAGSGAAGGGTSGGVSQSATGGVGPGD
jgi:hypothetical protein